jgi:hypothetical protein
MATKLGSFRQMAFHLVDGASIDPVRPLVPGLPHLFDDPFSKTPLVTSRAEFCISIVQQIPAAIEKADVR